MARRIPALSLLVLALACGDEDGESLESPPDDLEIPDPPPVAICAGDREAHRVLDAYWYTFDRYYGAFTTRLPMGDWRALGEQACAELGDGELSDDALFDVLIGLARNFDDGHTELTAPELNRDEDAWVHAYPFYEQLYELEYLAEAHYVDGELAWGAQDWIGWGRIGELGYISITAMEEYSASGEQDDDVAAAAVTMADALAELGDVRGIVVDVRANEGGWDAVSLEIAAWFAGERSLAWSDRRRSGPAHDDFTPWVEAWVDAARPGAFAGPVVLLTSGGTFSAGDTFVLAMQGRANVTIMGEPSSGHFSDQLGGVLPNGWWVVLSGEEYLAADGLDYETKGVPVDVPIALDTGALAAGKDTMLEAALAELGG